MLKNETDTPAGLAPESPGGSLLIQAHQWDIQFQRKLTQGPALGYQSTDGTCSQSQGSFPGGLRAKEC